MSSKSPQDRMEARLCRAFFGLSTASSLMLMLLLSCLPVSAGDLLRGGAGSRGSTGIISAGGAGAQTGAGDSLHVDAQDRLARTSNALNAVLNMQRAANAAVHAMTADQLRTYAGRPVADGIDPYGLDPNLAQWTGALAPTTSTTNPNDITIVQQAQSALLYWKNFSVGRQTTLTFDQKAGGSTASEWIAFNKIEANARPSDILGTIRSIGTDGTSTTGGQIYIINPNGIIFHGSAQVDTHALVASTLPLNDNLRKAGLLTIRNNKQEFLFSGLDLDKLDDFDPTASLPASGAYGDVVVKAGAQLSSPTNANHVGGRIMLVGPKVTNQGSISTPDGQTVLAAGLQVGAMQYGGVDAALRGLDVYVGKVSDVSNVVKNEGAGVATNDGLIEAPRGNVTVTGAEVVHSGFIDSTTSASLNGSVILSANYDSQLLGVGSSFSLSSGSVALGKDSVIRIRPASASADSNAPEKIVGDKLALGSSATLRGKSIFLGENSTIYAPSGQVQVLAGEWVPIADSAQFLYTNLENQITFARGAAIDVAGLSNVDASVLENFVEIDLRGPELADSPLLRNNPALRGQKITIDIRKHGAWDPTLNNGAGGFTWIGTPLADVRGYVGLVQRTVEQLSTRGGTVDIEAGGSIAMAAGSTVDVSGGSTRYTEGFASTSRVMSDGKWIDIANATPDRLYTGIQSRSTTVVDSKWGVAKSWTAPQLTQTLQPGYDAGGDGGTLSMTAAAVGLDGNLLGRTTPGERQITLRPTPGYIALPNDYLPTAGKLTLSLTYQNPASREVPLTLSPEVVFSSVPDKSLDPVTGSENTGGTFANLPDTRVGMVVLSPDLFDASKSGFGQLSVNNPGGNITIKSDLQLPTGGALDVTGINVTLADNVRITAPGGSLAFSANNLTPSEKSDAANESDYKLRRDENGKLLGEFKTGTNVVLDTQGKRVDLSAASEITQPSPRLIDGGSITVKGLVLTFGDKTKLDVSGGLVGTGGATTSWGRGGLLTIDGGRETDTGGAVTLFVDGSWKTAGSQTLAGLDLVGYGGKQGGTLNLIAPYFQFGGSALRNGDVPESGRTLWFNQTDAAGNLVFFGKDNFTNGGFSKFAFTGFAGTTDGDPAVRIVEGTHIVPKVSTLTDEWTEKGVQLAPQLLPERVRLPVNLSFEAKKVNETGSNTGLLARGDLVVENNTLIQTDPGETGSVTLKGATVSVDGKVIAPGGKISVQGGATADLSGRQQDGTPLVTVQIGSTAELNTAGVKGWSWTNALGYSVGSVLNGGEIKVSGNVLAEKGAKLDVSGASDELSVMPEQTGDAVLPSLAGNDRAWTQVDGNGGKIWFSGSELLAVEATLLGKAGSLGGASSAQGGALIFETGFAKFNAPVYSPTSDFNLTIGQHKTGVSTTIGTALRKPLLDEDTAEALSKGGGFVAADVFAGGREQGGFRSIQLNGAIQFRGDVKLSASQMLRIGDKGVIATDSNAHVVLDAPYVFLGMPFIGPLSSQQEVNAQAKIGLVDSVGNVVGANFTGGTGVFDVKNARSIDVGNLALEGFNLATLTTIGGDIRGDGTLSMAGQLKLDAANIYPQTAGRLNLIAHDYVLDGVEQAGSITFGNSSGHSAAPPLSAGGRIGVYASVIDQGGVLRAPMGSIFLGKLAGNTDLDPMSLTALPETAKLTLLNDSITSVSARIDETTGLVLPYGVNLNGNAWIDPTSTDISQSGVPEKNISLSAGQLKQEREATIDVSGGGDLLAYRWVSGLGGSKDILASETSFAVVPGYTGTTNASAPYTTSPDPVNDNLGASGNRDKGYVNSTLSVGDKIRLDLNNGKGVQDYTLLPARYALLPGAFLVTPKSVTPPVSAVALPAYYDNTNNSTLSTYLVRGYRFNDFDAARNSTPLYSSFEVTSQAVVLQRAQYDLYYGGVYLKSTAEKAEVAVPRLPQDAGRVLLASQVSLDLQGKLTAFVKQGRGSEADISSTQDIMIGTADGDMTGKLLLDPGALNAFGAESLLIGGSRGSAQEKGTLVSVSTGTIEVNANGSSLTGPEVILAAKDRITVKENASIKQSGTVTGGAETLVLGDATAGIGNGVLLRATSDANAGVIRQNVNPDATTTPVLEIAKNATITGAALTLDSTKLLSLDSQSHVAVENLNVSNQQIGIRFSGTPGDEATSGLLLTGDLLTTVQKSTRRLTLTSSSSIDLYGSGAFGTLGTNGAYSWDSLVLHAGSVRGFDATGNLAQVDADATVQFLAKEITLDNRWSANTSDASAQTTVPTSGKLSFQAQTLTIAGHERAAGDSGSTAAKDHTLKLEQYGQVKLTGTQGVQMTGIGRLETQGDLALDSPQIAGAVGSDQTLKSGASLRLTNDTGGKAGSTTAGLGAKLSFLGETVDIGQGTTITAQSGTVNLQAVGSNPSATGVALKIDGQIDVRGTSKVFQGDTASARYTDAGRINLQADQGAVAIAEHGLLDLNASADVNDKTGALFQGSAGTLSVKTINGEFASTGTITAKGGSSDPLLGGAFLLDVKALPKTSALDGLANNGFTRSQAIRVRTGNVELDSNVTAHSYTLSADDPSATGGKITVTGTVDASGSSGGTITIAAQNDVELAPTAKLDASGDYYDDAGKGGAVSLETVAGTLRMKQGSNILLGVSHNQSFSDFLISGGVTGNRTDRDLAGGGTLHLRAPQILVMDEQQNAVVPTGGVQIDPIMAAVTGASNIVVEGYRKYDLTDSGGYITDALKSGLKTDADTFIAKLGDTAVLGSFANQIASTLDSSSLKNLHFQPGVEIVNAADTTIAPVTINNITALKVGETSAALTGANTIALSSGGSTVTLAYLNSSNTSVLSPPSGATITVLATAAANYFRFTGSVTITKPGSSPVSASPGVYTQTLPAGTIITFNNSNGSIAANNAAANTVPLAPSKGTYAKAGTRAATVTASAGDLTLLSSWDLSTYRFKATENSLEEPGVLTLRAAGNLVFPATSSLVSGVKTTTAAASLSDGFDSSQVTVTAQKLWLASLMESKSWSYRLVAGADTGAADFHQVQVIDQLPVGTGSLLLGQGSANLPTNTSSTALRDDLLAGTSNKFYQTIRTGTGDIDISAGRDVQFLNPVATIYTAGRQASNVDGFDNPVISVGPSAGAAYSPANGYGMQGGNLSISAQGSIVRLDPLTAADASSLQTPNHWLYRRSQVASDGTFAQLDTETYSTTWWVDYSNFFDDVATLGGGNVTLHAGADIRNVNASVATNARMPGNDTEGNPLAPKANSLVELGGGDLVASAGANIDGGIYYVERGLGALVAAGSIKTNSTRYTLGQGATTSSVNLLPTTLFAGKARFSLLAGGDLTLGGVVNPFLLPQSYYNRPTYRSPPPSSPSTRLVVEDWGTRTFFSTFSSTNSIAIGSLGGEVTLQGDGTDGSLRKAYAQIFNQFEPVTTQSAAVKAQPWLRILEGLTSFNKESSAFALLPGTLRATAFSNDLNLTGNFYLSPSAVGTAELQAAGAINAYQPLRVSSSGTNTWGAAKINLLDADPTSLPSIVSPINPPSLTAYIYSTIANLLSESTAPDLATQQQRHAGPGLLHAADLEPVRLYAEAGDISGLNLFSSKAVRAIAGRDITDTSFYVQNNHETDVSVIAAGRDLIPYAPGSRLSTFAILSGGTFDPQKHASGDLEISGSGTLEVLAGRDLDLGVGGTGSGIVSVANENNPSLPKTGADIIAAAGIGLTTGLDTGSVSAVNSASRFNFKGFIQGFLNPENFDGKSSRYLPALAQLMNLTGGTNSQVRTAFDQLSPSQQARYALDVFFLVLRDTGRDYNNPDSDSYRSYKTGRDAIAALFPRLPTDTGATLLPKMDLASKNVRTKRGGSITLLNPFGKIDLGFDAPKNSAAPPGVITEYGGKISLFTDQSVNVGALRIFTLRGGDVTIWSDHGNIAAGFSSKTIQSAPPTSVVIDPQSADLKNDLSGLATGGGIGVLATVVGVQPGDVDLIAPAGTIDAGDAGIRSSGKVNVSALVVVNAANIQSGGGTSGTPVVVAPNISGLTTASNTAAGTNSSVGEAARQQQRSAAQQQQEVLPSIIQVEILGYGGGEGEDVSKKKDDAGNG